MDDVYEALQAARQCARVIRRTHQPEVREAAIEKLIRSFDRMDAAGVFAVLDEQAGIAQAEAQLSELTVHGGVMSLAQAVAAGRIGGSGAGKSASLPVT